MAYNPGVVDRSGEIFAGGLMQGLQALSQGMMMRGQNRRERAADERRRMDVAMQRSEEERHRSEEEQKRLATNGKIAEMFAKNNPGVFEALGMTPEGFSAQSAEDKFAAIEGLMKRQVFEQQMAQLQALNETVREARRRDAARAKFSQGLEGLGEDPGPGDLMGLALRSGMGAEEVYRLGQAAEMGEEGFTPGEAVPVEGTDYIFAPLSRRSGTVLPKAGMNGGATGAQEKVRAPNESWIYTEDMDLFKEKLQGLDPATRDAVLAARRAYNLATGKGDVSPEELMMRLGGGGEMPKDDGRPRFRWDSKAQRVVD